MNGGRLPGYKKEREDDGDFVGRRHGESLSKFIARVISPNKEYLQTYGRTTDNVADLMKSKMVPYKVGKTTKGGSLGKGTAVKQMADADLLFQLGGIGSVKELGVKLPEIPKTLQSALDRSGFNITSIKRTTYTIQFKISIDKEFFKRSAPYILDPAFPFHNLIRQKSGGIDDKYVHLERYAKKMLKELKDQDYRSKRGEL
ncbi:OAS [Mytilus edulis]|uniref:OAS n=1 Tax=Mytilus edulis TaxID=6550 RepID=A0A8S3T6Y7_MYTED|nr:OAS [Mytilus edulis]